MLTYGGERVEDEFVHLRLISARQDVSKDASQPVIELTVMPFVTWQVVKRRIKERWPGLKVVPDQNIRLLHKSVELRGGSMVDDYNMEGGTAERPVELQYLIIDQASDEDQVRKSLTGKAELAVDCGLYVDAQVPCTQTLRERVQACLGAMMAGIQPRLTEEGTGATYMLRDSLNRTIMAVFKPKDEEAFAPQNPRGYVGAENTPGLRQGVLSTQQAAREVAAYLLDHFNFAGVPETTLAHSKHPKFSKVKGKSGSEKTVWKIGALQAFVQTKDTAGNFAPQVFAVEDVHRIGILDVRIVNLDRNDGNVLVRHIRDAQGVRYELLPIDHGLSLPDRLEVYTDDMAWMSWPQARQPFGERAMEYIKSLNGPRDARLLAKCLGVRRECLRLMEVTTRLLQIGVDNGLTLYDIGTILYRVDRGGAAPVEKSLLEKAIERSLDVALAVAGEGQAANAVISTLAGLDLASARHVGGHKFGRQMSGAPSGGAPDHRDVGLTPNLGPSSPLSSPLAQLCLGASGVPPFSLDGLSESDGIDAEAMDVTMLGDRPGHGPSAAFAALASPAAGAAAAAALAAAAASPRLTGTSTNAAAASPMAGTSLSLASAAMESIPSLGSASGGTGGTAPARSTARQYRQSYKAGGTKLRQRTSAALSALHREGGSGGSGGQDEAGGAIFSRTGLHASDWPPELEKAFRRQINCELTTLIRKQFRRASVQSSGSPTARAAEGEGVKQIEGLSPAAASSSPPAASPSFGLPNERGEGASADAADGRRESDGGGNSRRRSKSRPDSSDSENDAGAGSLMRAFGRVRPGQEPDSIFSKPAGAGAYVPPHMRKMQGAGAPASASAASADGGGGGGGDGGGGGGEAAEKDEPPAELPARSRGGYVPPQERARLAAEAAASAEAVGDSGAVDSGAGSAAAAAEAPKRKYIPPQLRKQMAEAAAAAAAAAGGGAAGGDSAAASGAAAAAASSAEGGADDGEAPVELPSDVSDGDARHGYCVAQGPRASMEDAVDAIKGLGGCENVEFYAVYDGHSGQQAVKHVKRRLPREIIQRTKFVGEDFEAIQTAFTEAFSCTDAELLKELQRSKPMPKANADGQEATYVLSSGCVGCVVVVRDNSLFIANLGDCRAVLCNDGEMVSLTMDHRAEVNDGERERLKAMGVEVSSDGYVHGRIGVSRAFGDWAWGAEEKCRGLICQPDITEATVGPETEFLLLGCDGIFEKMSTRDAGQTVRRRLRATGDAKAAAEALVKMALKSDGSDNVSAIVVVFKKPEVPADAGRTAPRLFGRRPAGFAAALAAEEGSAAAGGGGGGGAAEEAPAGAGG